MEPSSALISWLGSALGTDSDDPSIAMRSGPITAGLAMVSEARWYATWMQLEDCAAKRRVPNKSYQRLPGEGSPR